MSRHETTITAQRLLQAERQLRQNLVTDLEFFQLVHEVVASLTQVDAFYLCRVQRNPDWLHYVFNCEGGTYDYPDPYPLGSGPTSQVARTGVPRIIVEPQEHAKEQFVQFGVEELDTLSQIHWPIWVDSSEPMAPDWILSVQAYPSMAYEAEDVAIIEWIALRVADRIRSRGAAARLTDQIAQAEHTATQNRAIADVRKFNAVLDSLRRQFGDTDGLASAIQHIQMDLAQWASSHQVSSDELTGDLNRLSDRELEVLSLVALGNSTKSVGTSMSISEHTVKRHLDNIYAKTALKRRSDVLAAAPVIQRIWVTRSGH